MNCRQQTFSIWTRPLRAGMICAAFIGMGLGLPKPAVSGEGEDVKPAANSGMERVSELQVPGTNHAMPLTHEGGIALDNSGAFVVPVIPVLSLEEQRDLLSKGLVGSVLRGAVEGMPPIWADDETLKNHPNTWRSWILTHGTRLFQAVRGDWHSVRRHEAQLNEAEILDLLVSSIGAVFVQSNETGESQIASNELTNDKLRTHFESDNALFEAMVSFYAEVASHRSLAQEQLLEAEIDQFFSETDLPIEHRTKLILYQTLLPLLIEHAKDSGSTVTWRKLTETQRSLARLLDNRRHVIACRENATDLKTEISFDPIFLIPNTQTAYQVHTFTAENERFPATRVSCQVVETQEAPEPLNIRLQKAMDDTMSALMSKDNDAIVSAMHILSRTLWAFGHAYGYNAAWNDHWENAPVDSWLCQLQILSLQALEQHRFAELAELERAMAQVYRGSTFYRRLTSLTSCQTVVTGEYQTVLARLLQEHEAIYNWIIENYAPKMRKKFDKNFSKWTRRLKPQAALARRLLTAWTFWSDGDFAKAARYAGTEVTKGKSRLVHPQLHSFDIVLKAIRGTSMTREELETYVNVIQLKTPAVVFQTLAEVYPWLDEAKRLEIVEIVSPYSPAMAPAAAAKFYQVYEHEFRQRLDASKRAHIGAWLEKEMRFGESDQEAQKRRVLWFEDMKAAGDVQGQARLREIVQNEWDSISPQDQAVWTDKLGSDLPLLSGRQK